MDQMDFMNLAARLVLGLGIGIAGTLGGVGIGFFVVLMTAFAFDSPQRSLSPELVMNLEAVGLVIGVIGTWVAGLSMPLPKRVMLIGLGLGGLLFALGSLTVIGALVAALVVP